MTLVRRLQISDKLIELCTMFEVGPIKSFDMKTRIFLLLMLTASLYSCTRSRYATTGAYESDDAYYTSSDTYIADFALVDDEAQMAQSSDSASTSGSTDDYYDPNYSAPPVYTPNSTANSWNADPWNSGYNTCGNGFGSGFGNYYYGSHWNCSPVFMPSIGWNPYSGYYSNYTFMYGSNPYWNPYGSSPYGYNPYNSWYTPYYTPGYYSGWAYNPWYSPYNYYNTGVIDNSSGGGIVYGPRNPISTISSTNSSYSSGLFYNGTKRDLHTYVNEIETNPKPTVNEGATLERPVASKPYSPAAAARSGNKPSTRPTYTPAKPNRPSETVKPGLTKPREVVPQRDRNPSKPQSGRNQVSPSTPARERKPDVQSEPSSRPRSETPVRDTPRSGPRTESSPSRSSAPASSPSRSGNGGGGSTNSPRRK
jgi:hypothetical protein